MGGNLIEVIRSDLGCYEIPGAAEIEDSCAVKAEMVEWTEYNDLKGWEPWSRVYRAIDTDGRERWYFGE